MSIVQTDLTDLHKNSQKYVIPNKTTKSDVDLLGINTTCFLNIYLSSHEILVSHCDCKTSPLKQDTTKRRNDETRQESYHSANLVGFVPRQVGHGIGRGLPNGRLHTVVYDVATL